MTLYVLSRGGFGNVLFNYMAGYALSKKYNVNVIFINSFDGKRKPMRDYKIYHATLIIDCTPNLPRIGEKGFKYTPIIIPDPSKDWVLDGYFQSYKHSEEYIPEIKRILFPNKREHAEPTIMLHARRGDYLKLQHVHPVQSDEYYSHALMYMRERIGNFKVKVFSDDLPFIRTWSVLNEYTHEIVDIIDEEETFEEMRNCDHFIISNSSFSLLSYYFRENENAIVCMPSKWFGPSGPTFDLDDLVPPSENRVIFN